MILREIGLLVRDTALLLPRLPDMIADWCDRQVMAMHPPEMVPADDLTQWPNGEMPWCLRCDTAWPCQETLEADERLTNRAKHSNLT